MRARFSAVTKGELGYLMRTVTPGFVSDWGGRDKLYKDLERTVKDYAYTNLRIQQVCGLVWFFSWHVCVVCAQQQHSPNKKNTKVTDGANENEQYCEFNYTSYDKKNPQLDGNGNPRRLVRMEKGRFVRAGDGDGDASGGWLFADYQLADVPEALVKLKEKEVV